MARPLYRDQDLALPTTKEQSPLPVPQAGLWNNLPFWRTWSLLASGSPNAQPTGPFLYQGVIVAGI